MGLFVCMLLGIFIGWLNGAIDEVDEGLFARMGIGLLGGTIGNLIDSMIEGNSALHRVTFLGILCSVAMALILLGVARQISSYEPADKNPA